MPYSSNMAANIVLLILLLSSAVMPFSNGNRGKEYKICSSPASCGLIKNIEYPFLVYGRPDFCGTGIHGFKLHCDTDGDYPYIWEGSLGRLWVKSINTSTRTMLIHRDKNQICQDIYSSEQNVQSDGGRNFFKFGASVANLTLFLGCPNITSPNSSKLLCLTPDVNTSAYYLANGSSDCSGNVTLPMSMKALNEFNSSNGNGRTLESALEEPFDMEYDLVNSTDCVACQKSGGVCGSFVYSPSNFACYYPGNGRSLGLILGLGMTVGVTLIIALVAFCYHKKHKSHRSNCISRSHSIDTTTSDIERGNSYFGVPLFSYKDLQEATYNFEESRELGSGGFGRVYYGKLKDGREVAVKQLYEKSYRRIEQFMNEVQILTRLRHQNLVSLYGCTSPDCRELLLVYEYICNGTVGDHLYSEKSNSGYLSWATRMRIAIETANALTYLHASDIIHRDVKTNNILLDGNFRVKVADFGLSRLFPTDVTHVSTAPQGTPGYLDPEYHQCYQLTAKSDVYSFGVVLIELISSLPAVDLNRHKQEINLSNFATNRIQRCAFDELVDPKLGFGSDFRVRRMTISVAELAFRCLQHDKEFRPAMDEVLEVLKKIESADYSERLGPQDKKGTDHSKRMSPLSIEDEENDGARLLISSMHHHDHHEEMHPQSPNSVIDTWGSRSTTASNTCRQHSNVFYSLSN